MTKKKARKNKRFLFVKIVTLFGAVTILFSAFVFLKVEKILTQGCSKTEFRDEQSGQCLSMKVKFPLIQRGNPAVEYCIDSDGVVDQEGNCLFLGGKSCEIWDLFSGKCQK